MQSKMAGLAATSEKIGFKVNRGKSKIMRMNTTNEIQSQEAGHSLAVLYRQRDTDLDVRVGIGKVLAAFDMLKKYGGSRKAGHLPFRYKISFPLWMWRRGDGTKKNYSGFKRSSKVASDVIFNI